MKQVSYYVYGSSQITHKGVALDEPTVHALVVNIPQINMPSQEDHAKIPEMLYAAYKKYVLDKVNEGWVIARMPMYLKMGKNYRQMLQDGDIAVRITSEDGLRHALVTGIVDIPPNYPIRHTERAHTHLMLESEKRYWDECFWFADRLSGGELDTLIALVESGPLWPGDLPSKSSYVTLVELGLATSNVMTQDTERVRFATQKGRHVYMAKFGGETFEEAKANRYAKREIKNIMRDSKGE